MEISKARVISLVRGLAFAIVTGIYILLGGVWSSIIWCVYLGFMLTVALDVKTKDTVHALSSLLAGYGWAVIYVYGATWIQVILPSATFFSTVLAEFLTTGGLLFLHLTLFHKTWFNKIPYMFCAVATVFAMHGLEDWLYAYVSVAIGICMAVVTGQIILCVCSKEKKSSH